MVQYNCSSGFHTNMRSKSLGKKYLRGVVSWLQSDTVPGQVDSGSCLNSRGACPRVPGCVCVWTLSQVWVTFGSSTQGNRRKIISVPKQHMNKRSKVQSGRFCAPNSKPGASCVIISRRHRAIWRRGTRRRSPGAPSDPFQ